MEFECCQHAADTIERLQHELAAMTAKYEAASTGLGDDLGRTTKLLHEAERERDEALADAARYRILRRKVAIIEHDGILGNAETRFSVFEFLNLPHPTYVAPDAAIELDAAIDREVRAALGGEG